MIDLHNHVLPRLDDGAPDLETSRAMLARFAGLGVTRIVATPHLRGPLDERTRIATAQALAEVRPVAESYGIVVEQGFEHVIAPNMPAWLDLGEPTTLAGSKAILIETPSFSWPAFADSVLFELQLAGYRPVLAHPERYPAVQEDPELALRAAERGVVLQITTSSLAGTMGRGAQRVAEFLLAQALERQLLVVFSTDAHSDGQRLSKAGEGLDRVRRAYQAGEEIVRWATSSVPTALLDTGDESSSELDRLRAATAAWSEREGKRRWRPLSAVRGVLGSR